MGVTNYKITAPVSIADVESVIGTANHDLGSLCRKTNINRWSIRKPQLIELGGSSKVLNISTDFRTLTTTNGTLTNYIVPPFNFTAGDKIFAFGMSLPKVTSIWDDYYNSIFHSNNPGENLITAARYYQRFSINNFYKPFFASYHGIDYSNLKGYRLTDFNGYNHKEKNDSLIGCKLIIPYGTANNTILGDTDIYDLANTGTIEAYADDVVLARDKASKTGKPYSANTGNVLPNTSSSRDRVDPFIQAPITYIQGTSDFGMRRIHIRIETLAKDPLLNSNVCNTDTGKFKIAWVLATMFKSTSNSENIYVVVDIANVSVNEIGGSIYDYNGAQPWYGTEYNISNFINSNGEPLYSYSSNPSATIPWSASKRIVKRIGYYSTEYNQFIGTDSDVLINDNYIDFIINKNDLPDFKHTISSNPGYYERFEMSIALFSVQGTISTSGGNEWYQNVNTDINDIFYITGPIFPCFGYRKLLAIQLTNA